MAPVSSRPACAMEQLLGREQDSDKTLLLQSRELTARTVTDRVCSKQTVKSDDGQEGSFI